MICCDAILLEIVDFIVLLDLIRAVTLASTKLPNPVVFVMSTNHGMCVSIAGTTSDMFGYYRSKTVPPPTDNQYTFRGIKSSATLELERRAKVEAERAAKVSKRNRDGSRFYHVYP